MSATERDQGFVTWLAHLESRHLADLQFPEVVRALRALSVAYVERRDAALPRHRALDGAGKRAAYALYHGPRRFLSVTHVAQSLMSPPAAVPPSRPVIDVGCGTGAAGAAVAVATGADAILGLDTLPWALDEARLTYAAFGLEASVSRRGAATLRPPRRPSLIVASHVANELPDEERAALMRALLQAMRDGSGVLVVEPLARSAAPWWPEWVNAFTRHGARADEWTFDIDPPALTRRLGVAAGLTPGAARLRTIAYLTA